ncbi:MAG: hypothetical protein ACKVHP_25195 [Verrucomicrobiales bacterium]
MIISFEKLLDWENKRPLPDQQGESKPILIISQLCDLTASRQQPAAVFNRRTSSEHALKYLWSLD